MIVILKQLDNHLLQMYNNKSILILLLFKKW